MSSFSSYPPRGKKSDFHVGYRSISDSHEPVSFDRLWRHVHPSTLSVYRCPYHGPMILVELHRRHGGSGVLTNYIFLPTFYVIGMHVLTSYYLATRIPRRSSPTLAYPISPWALFDTHDSLLDGLSTIWRITVTRFGMHGVIPFSHCERGGCFYTPRHSGCCVSYCQRSD